MVNIDKLGLDRTDRKIITELDRNCRIPSTILAKKVKKSRQAVEYRINKLVKNGIITSFNAALNPSKMGYKIYNLYFKLRNLPAEKQKLLRNLKSSRIVYWMGECSGKWDLMFGIFAKTDRSFFDFKNGLISEFNDLIVEKEMQIMLSTAQYPKMYFTNEISAPTEFGGEIVDNKIDALDNRILYNLVNNGRISLVDLTSKTNSTISIVQSRLRKLEKTSIIIQYRIGINLDRLGLEFYKAIIEFDRYTKEDENRILGYVSGLPNTQYFIRKLWAIELELVVSNFQEYYKIIEDLKMKFPEVIKSVDSVLMITDEWTPGFKTLYKPE
jgi:Lrp/AsnC family leucine-responsive transcriptional regulator